MVKLTAQQIEKLHGFIKKHYVEYYDVELELVDHLALGIETQWEKDNSISFEDALQREFKKFGVFGFMGMVEERQAALYSYYCKTTLKEVCKFFTLPKLLLTLSIFGLFYFLGTEYFYSKSYFYQIIIYSILGYVIIDGFIQSRKMKETQKKSGKNWLIYSVAKQFYIFPLGIVFCGFIPNLINLTIGKEYVLSLPTIIFINSLITVHILLIIITKQVIRPLIEKQIAETELIHKLV